MGAKTGENNEIHLQRDAASSNQLTSCFQFVTSCFVYRTTTPPRANRDGLSWCDHSPFASALSLAIVAKSSSASADVLGPSFVA